MSKLIKCKACGQEIAKGVKCPKCGADNRSFLGKHKILTVLLVLIAFGVLVNALGGNDNANNAAVANNSTSSNNSKTNSTDAVKADTNTESKDKDTEETKPSVPTESQNALAKAQIYSDSMFMSKKKIYEQLTSEAGEGFDKESAQYAVDNLKADYNKNALEKAKVYQSEMKMSKKSIKEQLTSDAGECFTESEAQYAIEHLAD